MGAWSRLDRRIEKLRRDAAAAAAAAAAATMLYACRPEAASPAGSFHGNHDEDQKRLAEAAFTVMG